MSGVRHLACSPNRVPVAGGRRWRGPGRLVALGAAALLACSDPVMDPLDDALDAYDQGRMALNANDAGEAVGHFAAAVGKDPDSPTLRGWQAHALAESGDLPSAIAVLDTALDLFPRDVDLRYNRAAYRARSGDLDGAAVDLRVLYVNDQLEPAVAGDDPDFAALAANPETADLAPTQQVEIDVTGEQGSVVLGETYTLQLGITSRAGVPLSFQDMGQPTGLLRHVRTVEDVVQETPRSVRRELSITWRTVRPGTALAGRWLVAAGDSSALSRKVAVEVVELPGLEPGAEVLEAGTVFSPSSWIGERQPPWIGRIDDRVVALYGAAEHVDVAWTEGEGPRPVDLEYRVSGQTKWTARTWPTRQGAQLTIRNGTREVLAETVAPVAGG